MTPADITSDDGGSWGRGILTPADRAYLRGEKTYEHRQSEHKRERELRERFLNSLRDFQVIAEETTREERKQLFDLDDVATASEVEQGAAWAIAVLHLLAVDVNGDLEYIHNADGPGGGHTSLAFERTLESGLKRALLDEDVILTDIQLTIQSREVPGVSEVRDRLESGRGIAPEVLTHLVDTGEIDEGAFREFVAEQLDSEE